MSFSKPEKGAIEIEVDAVRAPISAANVLKYVDARFYDGGAVSRAVRPDTTVRHDVRIEVIQFQIDRARRREQFAPIPLERTSVTGLKHVDGAVSMARSGPDTATASFSIAIGDQPEMDFGGKRNPDGQGFAMFGRVVRVEPIAEALQQNFWWDVFDWLAKYAEHQPDWADACLAVLSGRDKHLKIWTYDREFRTTWRRPDGTTIPMAVRVT